MALIYTDRSRYEAGVGFCPRARFLEYHSGPSGYGIRRKAESMPLARGIFVHEAVGALCLAAQAQDAPPGEAAIRAAALAATTKYRAAVEARGLAQVADPAALAEVIAEQESLIIGLTWTVGLEWLPWLLEDWRILDVEREDVAVLGCTCGIGDRVGVVEDHEARGCEGIGWQCRPDLIVEHRRTGALGYWEVKTAGQFGQSFETGWETRIQFSAGVLGAEARLGRSIDEQWVLGLLVGSRWAKDGPPKQNSIFCYGYRQPGQPPFGEDTWEWRYEDPERVPQRLPRSYQKAPVWNAQFAGMPADCHPSEYWVRWLPPVARQQQMTVVGPLNRQQVLLANFTAQVVAEERRWQANLWDAYETLQDAEWDARDPRYLRVLNDRFPCSWQCRRYGANHQCQFVPICFEHEIGADPLGSGAFVLRAPHHAPERQQMIARGVALPDDMLQDEEGEE